MSIHKQDQVIQKVQHISQLSKTNYQKQMQWLLRSLLIIGRQPHISKAGFVLPTTVLLLLVVSLTVGALIVRSFSRTSQVVGERQQQQIYNAATPAIDRAKAKLEHLFNDPDYPNGVPAEDDLVFLMSKSPVPGQLSYTLNGETRLDINGDGTLDNAWTYKYRDATGQDITVAYSILMDTEKLPVGANPLVNLKTPSEAVRAKALVVRNGPVNPAQLNPNCLTQDNNAPEQGWFKDTSSTSILRKNFQVNAVVLKKDNNQINESFASLELQQDRRVDRGNKWAAWFRNDLEIFPGPDFRLNGAISTEGSLILGSDNKISSHLISSPASCLYGVDGITASEINLNDQVNAAGTTTFQGQVVSGTLRDNTFNDNTAKIYRSPTLFTQLAKANDSVKATVATPILVALDPLGLFTGNLSQSRNKNDLSNANVRDTSWDANPLVKGDTARVFSRQASKPPYLDDTYRADNRYGPNVSKERYGSNADKVFPPGKVAGQPILATDNFSPVVSGFDKLTREAPPPFSNNEEDLGLDGYWERRARYKGLRVIVGQRLELGNAFAALSNSLPNNVSSRPNEALQRRTLRDNLAAVQATAIYHHEADKDFPIACIASTVHPGTAGTLSRSATFEEITFKNSSNTDVTLRSDFFTGRGTNGWEYNVPDITTDLANDTAPMRRALKNLAFFAGDPVGAYPPKQETAGSTIVHPHPELTNLGDFSNLRRALESNVPYANLSIADQSTIHSAACALGMLADNIKALKDYSYDNVINQPARSLLDVRLATFSDGNKLNGEVAFETTGGVQFAVLYPIGWTTSAPPPAKVKVESPSKARPEAYIRLLPQADQKLARLIYLKEQVELDRSNGKGYKPNNGGGYTCDASKFKLTPGGNGLQRLCPFNVGATTFGPEDVKYSALYYIFPTIDHPETRTTDSYITSVNPPTNLNLYSGIGGVTNYDETIDNSTLEQIRLPPRSIGGANPWKLDTEVVAPFNTAAPNSKQNELIKYVNNSGVASVYRVPFKDTALFNGREMMNVRVLNVDLDLLRKNKPVDTTLGDTWLPKNGIVFAFREDAIREGGIARPEIGSWANFVPVWLNNTASGPPSNWRMNASPNPSVRKDPPLNQDSGISPKPIDYYPDPERRPYGFRLKNGENIARVGVDKFLGLSFISDNPIYIQGDFNLHQKTNGLIEEFTQKLLPDWSNFYTRTTLDPDFSKDTDSWRPSEILGDAVTILSDNFCDGSIEDGIITAGNTSPTVPLAQYGCANTGNGSTSYINQNRPSRTGLDPTQWTREEDLTNPTNNSSPIKISEYGAPVYNNTAYNGTNDTYYNFGDDKAPSIAAETRINAMIISGIVASRANQSFGGFHNFPRFLENWSGINLWLSGSFLQLNFSTSATGPFDQDDWEPTQTPPNTGAEYIRYYDPPNRLWGYDVGLQSRPAGPVSRRFTVPSPTRSEYYKELPLDDAYILNLRCANIPGEGKVDPKATCP